MSVSDIVAIAGVVVAVVGAAIAIYYGRKALNPPKRLILWHADATPLLSGGHADYHDVISVRVLDRPVEDPYIGRLTVENTGRQDIDSSAFDQGRPIKFEVRSARKEATFLDPEANPPGLHVRGNSILIGPELLRANSKWAISFVTNGRPTVVLADSYLVNIDVREEPVRTEDVPAERSGYQLRTAISAAVVSAAAGVLAALINAVLH